MSPDPVIEITNLKKIYRRGFRSVRVSVDGLSLKVERGEVFGLIGPNGAGKTTTIKCLLGFVRPTEGTMRILGRPGNDPAVHERLGFLPETAVYYPFLTARQTLAMYARLFGMSKDEQKRRVESLLELVHLTPHADDKIQTYSKGMAQRVGIAQALLNNPDVMILDEPATGLDPLGQKEIRDLICNLREQGKTVFFSSHELGEVETVCDRAAIVVKGRVRREGPLAELRRLENAWILRVRGKTEILDPLARNLHARVLRSSSEEQHWRIEADPASSDPFSILGNGVWPDGIEVVAVQRAEKSLEDVFLETIAASSDSQTQSPSNPG